MNAVEFNQFLREYKPLPKEGFRSPLIMGIVNITPDSFSDGGQFIEPQMAVDRALAMVEEGADMIDIGAESTRPGASPVSLTEELERLLPVIEQIRKYSTIPISVDTNKPEVMEQTVDAGASMINDIYALQAEGALDTAAKLQVPVCLMHMQGQPKTMQKNPSYPLGVVSAVKTFFEQRIQSCIDAGIEKHHIILDPGFGFGKNLSHNLDIMRELEAFKPLGRPLLLGTSRKSSIGHLLSRPVNQRMLGSLTTAIDAVLKGVSIIRTHDVDETYQAMLMLKSIHTHVPPEYRDQST